MKANQIEHLFVDESGDLGPYGSKYFTVVAVKVSDQNTMRRIMKKVRTNILKKKQKQLSEIKANNSSRRVREYVLRNIASSDCAIFAVVIEKARIFSHLYEVKEKLYNYFCGVLLSGVRTESRKLIIVIDKRSKNKLIREDLINYLKSRLNRSHKDLSIEIYYNDSYTNAGLQVADFAAWAINRKFNTGDTEHYSKIEKKISNKSSMELWK